MDIHRLAARAALSACCLAPWAGAVGADSHRSPYATPVYEDRAVKSMSNEDRASYLDGAGHGLSLAAELNGYPGPRHVLDLAGPLALTEAQRAQIHGIIAPMRQAARQYGKQFVEAEQSLDHLFAAGRADEQSVRKLLHESYTALAQVRGAHLQAHILARQALTPAQVMRYQQLRGYVTGHPH